METLRKDVHMLPYDWLVGIGTMGAGVEGPIRNFAIGSFREKNHIVELYEMTCYTCTTDVLM